MGYYLDGAWARIPRGRCQHAARSIVPHLGDIAVDGSRALLDGGADDALDGEALDDDREHDDSVGRGEDLVPLPEGDFTYSPSDDCAPAHDDCGNLVSPLTFISETDLGPGVIDPAKVTRTALQNAASIAGLMLTTEASVHEIPETEKPAPAMPGGHEDY